MKPVLRFIEAHIEKVVIIWALFGLPIFFCGKGHVRYGLPESGFCANMSLNYALGWFAWLCIMIGFLTYVVNRKSD